MSQNTTKWIDLSAYGSKIIILSFNINNQEKRILALGKDGASKDNFDSEVFDQIGNALEFQKFSHSNTEYYIYKNGDKFSPKELYSKLKNAGFEKVKPFDINPAELISVIGGAESQVKKPAEPISTEQKTQKVSSVEKRVASEPQDKPFNPDEHIEELLRDSVIIGKNRLGKVVREVIGFNGLEGKRFLHDESESQKIKIEPESLDATSGLFLRAHDLGTLNQCADAFINDMNIGEVKRLDDIKEFARVIFADYQSANNAQKEMFIDKLNQSIENGIGKFIRRKNSDLNSRQLFELVKKLQENANYKIYFAQKKLSENIIDIPAPLSIAIHEIATTDFATKDKNVTIVNPGSGSLFSKFARGTNLEIFENREDTRENMRVSAVELGLKDETMIKTGTPDFADSDLVIANIQSDWLEDSFEFSGEIFNRKEFKYIIEALEAKKPEASAFFSFKMPDDSDILDEYNRFLSLIARKYAIQGIANIKSFLHAGLANSDNLMVISIAENRPVVLDEAPQAALREKEINSYPEMWTWVTETIRANRNIANHHMDYDEDSVNKSDKERNYFQVPYVAASRLGQAETMFPKHLEEPTKIALAKMAKAFGDVDERVANEVGFSKKHLSEVAAPEQIDAVALETYAEEKGKKGFLLGDMTGIGKGRTLAMMALRQMNSGRNVVFLTQKDSNIRDLFRDFTDLGVSTKDLNYIIFNNNTSFDIEDPELGMVTVKNSSPSELIEMMRTTEFEVDVDGNRVLDEEGNPRPITGAKWPEKENGDPVQIVFATYSQFSKSAERCVSEIDKIKINFLNQAIDENTVLILDECQSAAGQSNTGKNIKAAVDACGLVRYSSATHLKRASATPLFNPLFPEHMSEEEVKDIMERGGENIQEVVSSMLARDGVFLRREHDNSALEYETVLDTKREERNRSFVDMLSPILSELCYLSGDVNRRIQDNIDNRIRQMEALEFQREHNLLVQDREQAQRDRRQINQLKGVIKSMQGAKLSFGSPLYNLSKIALAALKTDFVIEQALEDLRGGKKPVLVVDSTLETLLRELYIKQQAEGMEQIKEPDFKDLFLREIEKLTTKKRKDDNGVYVKDENGIIIRDPVEPDNERLHQRLDMIKEMVRELPDLSVSFIDRVKKELGDAGFSCGEITARKIEYHNNKLQKRIPEKKVDVVDKFNNGTYDAILINKSGSTGISLHAAEWFQDRRQRTMRKLDVSNDIVEEVQTDGRIHRRGQVVNPKIYFVDSGVPFETRLIATKNQKLRRLSANVTSNRENAALIGDVLDMINAVGDEVCARYANARPELLEQLGLERNVFNQAGEDADLDGPNDDNQDTRRSANQILARLGMLPCAMQTQILEELQAEYEARIMELEAENKNPLKPKQLKGEIVTKEKTIFEGSELENPNNVFDDPVYIETCIAELSKEPINGEMLDTMVANAQESLMGEDGDYFADRLERIRMDKLNEAFAFINRNNQYATLQGALDANVPELMNLNNRIDTLITLVRDLKAGCQIRITDETGEATMAIVNKVTYPQRGFEHNASKYRFQYVVPGDAEPRVYSFEPLLKNTHFVRPEGGFHIYPGLNNDDMDEVDKILNDFDNAQDFIQKRRVQILTGNTFRAMQIAVENKIGSMCVYYDKKEQIMKRGVIVSGNIRNVNMAVPVRFNSPEMCFDALNENNLLTLYPDQKRNTRSFLIKSLRGGQSFEITLPHPNNKQFGKIYESEFVADLRRRLQPQGNVNDLRGQKNFKIDNREDLLRLIRVVMNDHGINFYTDPKFRNWSNNWQERKTLNEQREQENARVA